MPEDPFVAKPTGSPARSARRRRRASGAPGQGRRAGEDRVAGGQGQTWPQIAQRVGCTEPTAIKWRRRYAESLAGLEDAPLLGGPKMVLRLLSPLHPPARSVLPGPGLGPY